jgi:hypothetical protein
VAADQTPKIVLSYRRSDSAMAGRIFDRLAQHFGKANLFIDIDNVPFGVDFRKHIDDALQASDVLIAVVGEKWLGPQADGKLRINNSADPVRVELETALKRNITVLPVLLDGTSMPDAADLPEGIREFAYRNAIEVESGRDFNVHIDRLIRAMEQILGIKAAMSAASSASPTSETSALASPATPPRPTTTRSKLPLILAAGLLTFVGLATALWFARDRVSIGEQIDPTTGTAYCTKLKQVIVEARSDFTSILGREDGAGIWVARIQLPGWDDCLVADWTTEGKIVRYFGCALPSVATVDELHAKRDSAVPYLRSCLGEDWSERRITNQTGATETNYEMGPDDPVARIRETIYTDGRGNILRIEVDAPHAKPAAPAVNN